MPMRLLFLFFFIVAAYITGPSPVTAQNSENRGVVEDPMNDETVDPLGTIIRSQIEEPTSDEYVAPIQDGAVITNDEDSITAFEEDDARVDPDFLSDDVNAYDDYSSVTVRILDKITAETRSFDLAVGKTVKFGSIRIRPMICKKSPPIEEPESVSFLQIWERLPSGENEWIFSGWMFASSPSLSAMDHPVYDVWVLDCKD